MVNLKSQSISQAAFILFFAAVIRSILGVGSQMVIAAKFGASAPLDAYLVAFFIPQIISDFMLGGAVFFAFIPVFMEYQTKEGEEEAGQIINSLINLLSLILLGLMIIYIIFVPSIMRLLAPGFDEPTMRLTINLARFLAPLIMIMGLTLLVSAAFYGYQSFTVPSLCGLIPPCLIISSVLLFGHRLGIHSLAAGVMVGLLLQLGLQWYFFPKRGPKGFRLRFYHPAMRKILLLMLPIILGTILSQVNPAIQRVLASRLREGSIAAFNFAQMVNQFTSNILISPIIMALFPFLVFQFAKGEKEKFDHSVTLGIRIFNFIALPITFYLIFFSTPIIKILFEYGRFGTRDTALTAGALTYLGIGLFAGINLAFLSRAFCALQDTLTPLIASVFCALACIPLNLILVKYLDLNGLALTTSLISIICFSIVFLLFHLKVRVKGSRLIFVAFIKTLLITSVMGIISYLIYKYSPEAMLLIPRLIISVLAGGIVFILLSYLIRMEEFFLILRNLRWEKMISE